MNESTSPFFSYSSAQHPGYHPACILSWLSPCGGSISLLSAIKNAHIPPILALFPEVLRAITTSWLGPTPSHLSLFPWAKFRATKGGIKLHTLLDHDGYIPAFVQITAAKVGDLTVAKLMNLAAFSIVVMDRAYVDFAWFQKLNEKKIFFVTRMKRKIKYHVLERGTVNGAKGLTSDQTIRLTGARAKGCPVPLRRVGYLDEQTGQHYVFLTNIFHLSARTIADIYRERWQVELFFKWIKQNLKIKSFLGTSKNAVMTQIWVALIALLLLAYYKFRAKLGHSLSQILKLLQLNLFSRSDLWHLFDPGPTKLMLPNSNQLLMDFGYL
jgi:putative transposase